jgi:hypothetical protein
MDYPYYGYYECYLGIISKSNYIYAYIIYTIDGYG